MKYFEIVAKSTGGDEAIYRRSNRVSGPAPCAIQVSSFFKERLIERTLNDRKTQERFTGQPECCFILKPLKYLLNDGEARHDLFQFKVSFDIERISLAEDLDPD